MTPSSSTMCRRATATTVAAVNRIDCGPLIHERISSRSTMHSNALSRQHGMRSFMQELCYVLFEALETQFAHTSLKGFVSKW